MLIKFRFNKKHLFNKLTQTITHLAKFEDENNCNHRGNIGLWPRVAV